MNKKLLARAADLSDASLDFANGRVRVPYSFMHGLNNTECLYVIKEALKRYGLRLDESQFQWGWDQGTQMFNIPIAWDE